MKLQIFGEMFTTKELIESVENTQERIQESGGELLPADDMILQAFWEELQDRAEAGDPDAVIWELEIEFDIMITNESEN